MKKKKKTIFHHSEDRNAKLNISKFQFFGEGVRIIYNEVLKAVMPGPNSRPSNMSWRSIHWAIPWLSSTALKDRSKCNTKAEPVWRLSQQGTLGADRDENQIAAWWIIFWKDEKGNHHGATCNHSTTLLSTAQRPEGTCKKLKIWKEIAPKAWVFAAQT